MQYSLNFLFDLGILERTIAGCLFWEDNLDFIINLKDVLIDDHFPLVLLQSMCESDLPALSELYCV